MKNYILKRLLYLIPVMIGVSIITFALINLAPGDPALEILSYKNATERSLREWKPDIPEGFTPVSGVALGYPVEPLGDVKELKKTISMNIVK
jgi:hypothetical protein